MNDLRIRDTLTDDDDSLEETFAAVRGVGTIRDYLHLKSSPPSGRQKSPQFPEARQ